jgi:hypothetical protein
MYNTKIMKPFVSRYLLLCPPWLNFVYCIQQFELFLKYTTMQFIWIIVSSLHAIFSEKSIGEEVR